MFGLGETAKMCRLAQPSLLTYVMRTFFTWTASFNVPYQIIGHKNQYSLRKKERNKQTKNPVTIYFFAQANAEANRNAGKGKRHNLNMVMGRKPVVEYTRKDSQETGKTTQTRWPLWPSG